MTHLAEGMACVGQPDSEERLNPKNLGFSQLVFFVVYQSRLHHIFQNEQTVSLHGVR